MYGTWVPVSLGWLRGWVLDEACWRVWSRRRFHHKNELWCAVVRARLQIHQIVGNGAEGRLARGWGVEGLQEVGKLDVYFFKFPD